MNLSGYLSANVKRKSNNSIQSLSASTYGDYIYSSNYQVSNKHDFRRGYLWKDKEGKYTYYVLQKNGEPYPGAQVKVNASLWNFQSASYMEKITQTLKTNKEGIIDLGKLEDITKITL